MTAIGVPAALVLPQINATIANSWSYTKTNVATFTHVWTIVNFSFMLRGKPGEVANSVFFSAGINGHNWELRLLPKGSGDAKDYVSLFLFAHTPKDAKIRAKVNFFIVNARNEKSNNYHYQYTTESPNGSGYTKYVKRDYLLDKSNGLLPNDTLTIFCRISVNKDVVNLTGSSDSSVVKKSGPELPDDLRLFYDIQKLSDVTLVTRTREFQAHKAILAARSSVFAAMFQNDCEIRLSDRLEMNDVEPDVVREMLRFIYTDAVTDIASIADDVLAIADKFGLDKLKVICEQSLQTNITVEDAAQILILADVHSAFWLKARVKSFIVSRANEVMATVGFVLMTKNQPLLAAEVIHDFLTFFEKERNTQTRINVNRFAHVWTIANFGAMLCDHNEKLISPTFSASKNDGNKWQLEIYPMGSKASNTSDYVSLYLHLNSPGVAGTETAAKFKFYILDSKNTKVYDKQDDELISFTVGQSSGYNRFVDRNLLLNSSTLLPNDRLTVLCEIDVAGDVVSIAGPHRTTKIEASERQLADDLELLFESNKMADVTLVARGKEFRAHRAILAARSILFAATFVLHELVEQPLQRIELGDLDQEVVREMLHYMYTDRATNLETLGKDLLSAADEFALVGLKITCEQHLIESLDVGNAADLMILAKESRADRLMLNAVDFVNAHAKDVMDTASFKSMAVSHPHLAAEVLRTFLTHFREERTTFVGVK